MGKKTTRGTVYSTLHGRVCPRCGWPERDCRCTAPSPEAVPARVVARLRIEKAGRRGKTVTVIYGLPRNPGFLRELTAELKKACGSGGTITADGAEIQGDHRDRIRTLLEAKGWRVKG